ncbi:hypothetical protein EI555_010973, partial [Monodon monoceros]
SQVGGLPQAGEETQNPLGLDDCPPAVPALLRAAPKGSGSWMSRARLHLTALLEAKHSAEALGSGREQDQNLRPVAKAQRRNPAAKRKQTATARLPEVKSSTGFEVSERRCNLSCTNGAGLLGSCLKDGVRCHLASRQLVLGQPAAAHCSWVWIPSVCGHSQAEGLCGQAISSHDSSSNMNWVLRSVQLSNSTWGTRVPESRQP